MKETTLPATTPPIGRYGQIEDYGFSELEEYDSEQTANRAIGIYGHAAANAIVILVFMFTVLVTSAVVYGLIYYHYSNRTRKWLKITKTMHQRLSRQILREEKLVELCLKINVTPETVHSARKDLCPDIEEMTDLPAARYVDPFRAPSNMYVQINENDEDAKTLKNIDPDVFIKKEDCSTSANASKRSTSNMASASEGKSKRNDNNISGKSSNAPKPASEVKSKRNENKSEKSGKSNKAPKPDESAKQPPPASEESCRTPRPESSAP